MDKPHLRICLAAFLLDGALMVILTAMPFYVYDHWQGSVSIPASIGAAQSLLYALVCLGVGQWINHNRHSLRWASFGTIIYCWGSAGAVLIPGVWGFAVVNVLAIVGMSIVWPALHGWLGADPDPHRRARAMSRFNVSWSCGLAVGPLIGGFLYDYSPLTPFYAAFVMGVLCFGLLWGLPQEEEYYAGHAEEQDDSWDAHARLSERYLMAGWIANAVACALVGVTRLVFTKRVDNLVLQGDLRFLMEPEAHPFLTHNPASIYALLAFLLAAMGALAFGVMGLTHRWHHRFRYIAGLQIAAAAAFWLLGHTSSFLFMGLAFMVIGAVSGAAFFVGAYYSMAYAALCRQRSSVNEFFVGIGNFVGPISVGILAERYGVSIPFLYIPAAVLLGLGLQYYLIHRRRPA